MSYAPRKVCLSCGGQKESSRLHRCSRCSDQVHSAKEQARLLNPFWQTAHGKALKAWQAGKRYCGKCDRVMDPEEFGREGWGAYCLDHWRAYRSEIERRVYARKRSLRPPAPDPAIAKEKAFLSEFSRQLSRSLARKLRQRMASKVRKCKLCGLVLPVSAFGVAERRCNQCSRKRICQDPVRKRLNKKSWNSKKKEWLREVKLSSGCVDCGYREFPEALHFDHVDPSTKSFSMSRSFDSGWTALKLEVAKCVVRCANCHAVRSRRENHSAMRFTEAGHAG